VPAFPSHLAALGLRLEDAELRHLVLANRCDEKGVEDHPGRESASRAERWQDFAEGMGSTRTLDWHDPVAEIQQWVARVQRVASEGLPEEALATFYAYQSEMPRLAKEKNRARDLGR
jgi:pyrroloquinoline-quinone synthase